MLEPFLIDIEEELLPVSLLEILLTDRTTENNIFWATSDYEHLGEGFSFGDAITLKQVTGENRNVIMPRVLKSKKEKKTRTQKMAEIFTPTWVCNEQCNAFDESLTGIKYLFNTPTYINGKRDWVPREGKILLPNNVSWEKYISQNSLEITCGEAPCLVSRYDTTTGDSIPIYKRIGLLDRKLRIINENTTTYDDWYSSVVLAYQSTYGYEWQGDNILLARENLLSTFIDYYKERWLKIPFETQMIEIATIISWNIFQMDGLKMVLPMTCYDKRVAATGSLFDAAQEGILSCTGCSNNNIHKHNGIYAVIMDWKTGKKVEFRSLYKWKI